MVYGFLLVAEFLVGKGGDQPDIYFENKRYKEINEATNTYNVC